MGALEVVEGRSLTTNILYITHVETTVVLMILLLVALIELLAIFYYLNNLIIRLILKIPIRY